MLEGPYDLNNIDYIMTKKLPGVYILSRDGRYAHYVGRSDNDLANRIKSSAKEGIGYKYFFVEYASSPRDAYLKECEYYHKYNPPDNTNHPAVPEGTNWRCPVIWCEWS